MTQTWHPDIYLRYQAYRARPAQDLIKQIELSVDGPIYDLGCGPGNITADLKKHWPERKLVAVDNSAEMLAQAIEQNHDPRIEWVKADICRWQVEAPAALIFANASLHWVQDHDKLFPRLMESLKPDGILAVQMPVSLGVPYYECMMDVVKSKKWCAQLQKITVYREPLDAYHYYDLLSPLSKTLDVWRTDYVHVLEGDNPVLEWMKGTGLTLYTSVLNETDSSAFQKEYGERVKDTYPTQKDGQTLFKMPRFFLVAKRN